MDDRAKHRRSSADLAFILLASAIAVGLVVVTIALGGAPGIDPEQVLSIFAAP